MADLLATKVDGLMAHPQPESDLALSDGGLVFAVSPRPSSSAYRRTGSHLSRLAAAPCASSREGRGRSRFSNRIQPAASRAARPADYQAAPLFEGRGVTARVRGSQRGQPHADNRLW